MENNQLVNVSTGELVSTESAVAMQARLNDMKSKLTIVQDFFKKIMVKDEDYGTIPGTGKPTLYKPGAEKLLEIYNYAPTIKDKKEERDRNTGYYQAQVVVAIVNRNTGMIIAEGVGEASSYESKYRYRWVFENELPQNVDKGDLVKKSFTSKKDGKEYFRYRLDNPDIIDQWNTVLKMAKKRALVDATLSATRTSGIFTQSESEMEAWIEGEEAPAKDTYTKKKYAPSAQDEDTSFVPPRTVGTGKISEKQLGKILGEAKKKGIDESAIKEIIEYTKKKTINELTSREASSVIEFLMKSNEEDLNDLVLQVSMGTGGDEA